MSLSVQQMPLGFQGKPKAIIFDLLTTLVNTDNVWTAATPSKNPSDGKALQDQVRQETSKAGAYVPFDTLIPKAARSLGQSDSDGPHIDGGWTGVQEAPGSKGLLRSLQREGYSLGALSDSSRTVGQIAASKVDDGVFRAVVSAEDSGFYQPRGEAYKAVLDAMGVEAKDALFVAGNDKDLQGARASGMMAVPYNTFASRGDAIRARL